MGKLTFDDLGPEDRLGPTDRPPFRVTNWELSDYVDEDEDGAPFATDNLVDACARYEEERALVLVADADTIAVRVAPFLDQIRAMVLRELIGGKVENTAIPLFRRNREVTSG